MKQLALLGSMVLIVLGYLSGCSIAENKLGDSENPVPELTSISPDAKVSHMPSFTLTVTGSDFVSGSIIVFNGAEKTTTYVNSGELTCEIDPGDIDPGAASSADAGMSDGVLPVLVRNPAPGGGDSAEVNFTVYENHSFATGTVVADEDGEYYRPSIDVDDAGYIGVVFEYGSTSTAVTWNDVRYTGSQDGGAAWNDPVTIVSATETEFYPVVALDSSSSGAGVSAVNPSAGINTTFNAYGTLYFSRSRNGGSTWTSGLAMNPAPSNGAIQSHLVIDSGGGLNVVYNFDDSENCGARILFSRSLDNGASWSGGVDVYQNWANAVSAYNPRLAVDTDGGVFATWTQWPCGGSRYSFVYSNFSHDHGATWHDEDTYFGVCNSSDISVGPGGEVGLILAAAYLPFQYNIDYRSSPDRGVSWSDAVEAAANNFYSGPLVAIDRAGNVNVIYYVNEGCSFVRSIDSGNTWSTPVRIADQILQIDMTVDYNGRIYLVWVSAITGRVFFSHTI